MVKRRKGIAFLFLGCVLLLVAGGWYGYNLLEDKNAGEEAAVILRAFDDEPKSDESTPVITVNGDAFCGKVCIEKLDVELPVYNNWNEKRLKSAPCRYVGSVATDDIIIAAHNYKSHFGNLKQLTIGDIVTFVDAGGTTHTYAVCEMTMLDGTAVSDMRAGEWDFTLFTCTKSGKQRVTVRCERVQMKK